MSKVTLFAHKEARERVIQQLHALGQLQLIDLKETDLALQKAVSSDDVREISDLLLRISHLLSILRIAPVKQTMAQKLFGFETTKRAKVKRQEKADIIARTNGYLAQEEKPLHLLEEEHERALGELADLKEQEKVIRLLLDNNIPIELLGETEHIRFTVGRILIQNVAPLTKELTAELKGHFHIEKRDEGKRFAVIVIITLQEAASKVNMLIKKHGLNTFAFRKLPPAENPGAWIEARIEEARRRVDGAVNEIAARHHQLLDTTIFLREDLELLKERFEAVHRLQESKEFFLLQGWVTSSEVPLLKKQLKEVILLEEAPEETDEPPVRLSNPGFLKPFEMLTELYALPKYKDLDPTFIVAPLFLIFAGFMLTDFVYGLGLLLLGGVIYALFRKHDESMRHISISIFFIGFFSMIFGVLTGSYLGDAPFYFLGLSTAQLAIWKDPLADPLYFLIISLAVGLIHLNIGLILGTIEDVRKKAWRELVSSRVIWWLLQVAILCFVLGWGLAGKLMLAFTVLLVIILQGPLGILGMTGFMGDVISYSRLFALALSTAGIAMTVNLLADMLNGVPYVGFLLAALVFILGHLFSFLMNALGSFVHSIRLQFVEFFGKFYEGGGDKFTPFKEERVYTEVDE